MNGVNSVLSTGPVVLYSARAEGDFGATFVSPSVFEQTGYSPEQFTQDSGFWLDNIHPQDRGKVIEKMESLVDRGWVIQQYRFQFHDGSYREMRDEIRVVRDGDRVVEFAGYWVETRVGINGSRSITPEGEILLEVQVNIPGLAKRGDHILIRPGHSHFAVVSHHLTHHEVAELIKYGLTHGALEHLTLLE